AGITSWGLARHDSTMLADRLHFAFDESDLTPEDLAELDAKRQVLVAHPSLVIQIVGNADERGPDEYNLALGERRAAAAKRWLLAAGIAESRISIVSWGEEHPLDPAHNEAAWAQNRRDEFLVMRSSQ
ncbi:MAG: OmpA family protein, partial [Gemmatimonadales bacterium]